MSGSARRVLITGIGGSIGIDIARSLRPDPGLHLVGADGGPWGRRIGERLCDRVVELPRADREPEGFLRALGDVIEREEVDFVFTNPDPELEALAALEALPPAAHPLPAAEVIGLCLDKAATAARAIAADLGAYFPDTRRVDDAESLDRAFRELTPPLWLRATTGPGGRGSLPVDSVDEARAWIGYWNRRGSTNRWVLQELLPGRNFNWTALYVAGRRVAEAAMERLSYFLSAPTVSGVSGQVALCATVAPERFRAIGDRVVRALDPEPQGLYSVDLREDREGAPRVTEVNPRLAGRPSLFTRAGVNLPLAAVRGLLGGEPGDALSTDGLEVGVHLYRQLDVEPVFGTPEEPA